MMKFADENKKNQAHYTVLEIANSHILFNQTY